MENGNSVRPLSAADDINGDGIDDVIVGAVPNVSNSGACDVVFGRNSIIFADGFDGSPW